MTHSPEGGIDAKHNPSLTTKPHLLLKIHVTSFIFKEGLEEMRWNQPEKQIIIRQADEAHRAHIMTYSSPCGYERVGNL